MVAAGAGWTITTPLLFSRALQFHPRLRMHPFPGAQFARTLAIVASPDCAGSVLDLVDARMRTLVRERALAPLQQSAPWLAESFTLIG